MERRHQHELSKLLGEELDEESLGAFSPRTEEDTVIATPFPYGAVGILVLSNATAVASFNVVYPFIIQMIVELGISKSVDSAGYYSGLFESGVALFGFLTTIPCSYASDIYGRKSVLVASMIGLNISMLIFAVGRSFGILFIGRCIGGGFGPNSTWTASYTIIGEITDLTNAAPAYSAVRIGYSVGTMISPVIGGFLAHPSDRFAAFQGDFWKNNPYALPCFTGVLLGMIALVAILFGLTETLPSKRKWARKNQRQTSVSKPLSVAGLGGLQNSTASLPPLTSNPHTRESTTDSTHSLASLPTKGPITIWDVLTPQTIPVMITSFYLAFISAAWFAVYLLWAFIPLDKGGLGASESFIGVQLSISGFFDILVMGLYAPLEKRLGLYKVYALTMAMWIPTGLCYPLFSAWARYRNSSEGLLFQTGMLAWFMLWSSAGVSWAANSQMVNQIAPSEAALARTISASTICTLLGGTLGPVIATSLFQWSHSLEFANGNLIWILMFAISIISTIHASRLRQPVTDWRVLTDDSSCY